MSERTPAASTPCPICGKPAQQVKFRPFCGRRCADVDLNRWLSNVYAVPAAADDDDTPPRKPVDEEP